MDVLKFIVFSLLFLNLSGCSDNPEDPLEPFNRGVYTFNDTLDHYIAEPIAKGYVYIVPSDGRLMVTNFYSNLREPFRALNDFLQLKFDKVVDDLDRFVFNTTFGVLGLFDIADEALSIPKRNQDMGMTIAYWTNNAPSTFIMLPFYGPSTIRDTAGKIITDITTTEVDYQEGEYGNLTTTTSRWSILDDVNSRANLLRYERLMHLQLDPYIAIRHSYISGRNNLFNELNS
tara:strand:- start:147 stop:839 length:693 start_codon:yes stop_codon:yes gene_type:complete